MMRTEAEVRAALGTVDADGERLLDAGLMTPEKLPILAQTRGTLCWVLGEPDGGPTEAYLRTVRRLLGWDPWEGGRPSPSGSGG
jgi:hypothetical protein